jgi:hypothetical protein
MRGPAFACVLAFLSFALPPALPAQPELQRNGLYRIEGTVIGVDGEHSTISIRQRGHGSMAWTIHHDDHTSFSYRNAPASLEDVKHGRRIVCIGRYEKKDGRNEMVAVVVDVRTGR